MAHLVLYRNFRPKTFDEVIGQDHIVTTLKNQVKDNTFGHAYLFCGSRGTGKTSTAKIFARAINCESSIDGSACGKCVSCLSNLDNANLDIIEIDAASNNRVDEIRDLREKIGYLPSVNKYKVYIIDEVHMLTDSAFNALLKTLEEPPQHAVFILATTEPHKLPATILSRCMRFDFRLVSEEDLTKHLNNVLTKSNIKFDKESLKLIATKGNGSVRDTLSIAEMCSAYCSNNITYEKCLECLGVTDSKILVQVLNDIVDKNAQDLLQLLYKLKTQGKNFSVLVNDLIEALNNILTIKLTNSPEKILTLPKDTFDSYKILAEKSSSHLLVEYLKSLSLIDSSLKLSTNVEMTVETMLLSLIFEQNQLQELEEKVKLLQEKLESGNLEIKKPLVVDTPEISTTTQTENVVLQTESQIKKAEKTINEASDIEAKRLLGELALSLKNNGNMMVYCMLGDVKAVEMNSENLIVYVEKITAESLEQNKKCLQEHLQKIRQDLSIKISSFEANDELTTEEFLKQKFGDKLTII